MAARNRTYGIGHGHEAKPKGQSSGNQIGFAENSNTAAKQYQHQGSEELGNVLFHKITPFITQLL
jgi:hypothetical protein